MVLQINEQIKLGISQLEIQVTTKQCTIWFLKSTLTNGSEYSVDMKQPTKKTGTANTGHKRIE
jgi:hypothetical protein